MSSRVRIFTLYMGKSFFRPFFYGLGIFSILIFLGHMFDNMNHLVASKASLGEILEYLWLEVPYWTIRVIPMATLLAALVSITGFVQSGEWVAVQASGFEIRDFWRPILWCSCLVTLFSFAAQETVLPACYHKARQIWRDRIHPEWEWDKYYDIALMGGPELFLQSHLFLPKAGSLERPLLEKIGAEGVESQLDARLALWNEGLGRWVFYDGVERLFTQRGALESRFAQKASGLSIPPRQLIPRTRNADEMSLREIRSYRKHMNLIGVEARELEVASHGKLAYPFVNIVICALGIPLALRLHKSPRIVSFCAAMALSFFYLWFIEIGKTLGQAGALAPSLAAWIANLFFGSLALWLLRRYSQPF
ncbi:MAG: LptF/LptG family permease [Elusimicrobia bacterium]|nr:LptF/LptG family permease [Elusimicrobiota bacterium]